MWKSLLEPAVHKGSLSQQQMLGNFQALYKTPGRCVVLLSQGGHLAAAVFDCNPPQAKQIKQDAPPAFKAVEHKTFHRYVVR